MLKCLHRHAVFSSLPRLRFNVPVVVWLPVAPATTTGTCPPPLREPLLVIGVLVGTFHVGSVAEFRLRQRPEPSLCLTIPLRAAPRS